MWRPQPAPATPSLVAPAASAAALPPVGAQPMPAARFPGAATAQSFAPPAVQEASFGLATPPPDAERFGSMTPAPSAASLERAAASLGYYLVPAFPTPSPSGYNAASPTFPTGLPAAQSSAAAYYRGIYRGFRICGRR